MTSEADALHLFACPPTEVRTGQRCSPPAASLPPHPRYHQFKVSGVLFECPNTYALIRPIGKGAYGLVCSANDTRTGEKVAIKKASPPVGWGADVPPAGLVEPTMWLTLLRLAPALTQSHTASTLQEHDHCSWFAPALLPQIGGVFDNPLDARRTLREVAILRHVRRCCRRCRPAAALVALPPPLPPPPLLPCDHDPRARLPALPCQIGPHANVVGLRDLFPPPTTREAFRDVYMVCGCWPGGRPFLLLSRKKMLWEPAAPRVLPSWTSAAARPVAPWPVCCNGTPALPAPAPWPAAGL